MSTEDFLLHRYRSALNPYDVDMHFRASIPGINQLADRAAFDHIHKLDIPTQEMLKKKLAWVLFQKDFLIIKDLELNREYLIKTAITGRNRLFTYRDFRISDGAEDCVLISSAWLLFDLEKRRMLRDYPEHLEKIIAPGNAVQSLPRPQKLALPDLSRHKNMESFKVRFYDLDATSHVSNQVLMRRMLGILPFGLLDEKKLAVFRIQFREEALLDDELRLGCAQLEEFTWELSCTKGNKLIAFSQAKFAERQN